MFLGLFKRYLSNKPCISKARRTYPWYGERLSLISYSLMTNHIHLFVHQQDQNALPEFMKSLLASYSMYFNKTHGRVGPLFQSKYRAVRIDNQSYFEHISRYIHLNPKDWKDYPYSSLVHYRSNNTPEWLNSSTVLEIFENNISNYIAFLANYVETKEELDELKWQLADRDMEM